MCRMPSWPQAPSEAPSPTPGPQGGLMRSGGVSSSLRPSIFDSRYDKNRCLTFSGFGYVGGSQIPKTFKHPIKTSVARIVRPQDFVWLLLFSALAYVSANRAQGIPYLLVLAALQVLEPKVEYFSTPPGDVVSILLKLGISYALIGVTGGLTSSYFLILLLPLVS